MSVLMYGVFHFSNSPLYIIQYMLCGGRWYDTSTVQYLGYDYGYSNSIGQKC